MIDDQVAMAGDDSERGGLPRPGPPRRAVDEMQEALIARLGGKQKSVTTRTLGDEAPEPASSEEPVRLGRFEVLGRLGSGAMGVVYEALDPELDRRVAVKLLQPHRVSADALVRVSREAQALAQISHPNVVQVFAIGNAGEGVYVAMELIEGETLRRWQSGQPRSWQDTLEVYVQAAEGLCAIHDAGLVHRDFKPANVMRDAAGRVRVLDLGLVRGDLFDEPPDVAAAGASVGSASGSQTRSDAVLGTPAYMAPEQFLGAVATPASDQFSFCVAVFEALYGYRPFKATSPVALMEAVVEGRVEAPPAGTAVPERVHAALRRGLRHRPLERFGSVRELLVALTTPGVTGRKLGWAALALGGTAAAFAVYAMAPRATPCTAVVQLEEIWNAQSRAELEAALPPAEVAATLDGLDAHAAQLREVEEDACRARSAGAPSSDRLLLCRTASMQRFAAVVEVLIESGGGAPGSADKAVGTLQPPRCARDGGDGPSLGDENMREAALAVRLGERAKVLALASRFEEAGPTADDAVAAARRSTDPPTLSGALRERAGLRIREGNLAGAKPDFEEGYSLAVTARDDRGAARSALGLTWVSLQLGENDEANRWVRLAASSAEQADDEPELAARVAQRQGQVYLAQGNLEAAGEELERSLALYEGLGDPREIGTLLTDLQPVAMSRGDIDGALAYAKRAVTVLEDAFGPEDAQLGTALHNLGNVWERKGEPQRAYASHLRGLNIREAALGPLHGNVGVSAYAVATDLVSLDRLDEAAATLARARKCVSAAHPLAAAADFLEGEIESKRGNPEAATRLVERALVSFETRMGPDHPTVAEVRLEKAILLRGAGKFEEALVEAERVSAAMVKGYGPEHPFVGKAAAVEAEALTGLGRTTEALERYLDAIRIAGVAEGEFSERVGGYQSAAAVLLLGIDELGRARVAAEAALASDQTGPERATACFALARVLRRQAEDPERQQALVQEAKTLWLEADETDALARLSEWQGDTSR